MKKSLQNSWRILFLLSLPLTLSNCRQEEELVIPTPCDYSYEWPLSEYDSAGIVLVSTPDTEFTYGSIEKASEEHGWLVNTIKKNGVKVINIRDVIKEMSPDSQLTARQMIVQNLFYTRDQTIITPKGIVLGKMRNTKRKEEPQLINMCLHHMGINPIYQVSDENAVLEGGDYLPFGTLAFIANGLRTNELAIEELMKADVLGHDTIVVVNDRKLSNKEMHLDTYFNIIDHNLVTLVADRYHASRDGIYYLPVDIYARDGKTGECKYRKIENGTALDEFLERRGISIIPISVFDARTFACNYLCVSPRHVIAVEGQSEELQRTLRDSGVQVDWLPITELLKGNGAIHCMSKVLKKRL